ncbi:MAG: hypothetical protein ABI446_08475 [Gemmatimonadaceae bacterium]
MAMRPMLYREFYDVPRAILVEARVATYFLDCRFNEEADGYPDTYSVYRLRETRAEAAGTIEWKDIAASGIYVGTLRVDELTFDATLRESLDDDVFDSLPPSG